MKQAGILLLDDSLLMREALQRELERDTNLKVVAKASTAYEARDKIVDLEPDILIADVNLGGMSGIEFVKRLLPQYYMPTILISADHALGEVARLLGAVDFVPKPAAGGPEQMHLFCNTLIALIKSIVNEERLRGDIARLSAGIIAIGASTGGAQAIEQIVRDLPGVMPPIVVAQHMPEKFTRTFAQRLNAAARLSVKEAEDGDLLIPGQVYVAPGGMHTLVKPLKFRRVIQLVPLAAKAYLCPSVDMLFHSVAQLRAPVSVGVILTGMGKDGAAGLKHMHQAGSKTVGQDRATSVVYGMPQIAYDEGSVDHQLPLGKIAEKLRELAGA